MFFNLYIELFIDDKVIFYYIITSEKEVNLY